MKKLLLLLLIFVIILPLAACAGAESAPASADGKNTVTVKINNSDWEESLPSTYRARLPKPKVSLFVNPVDGGYRATFWGGDEATLLQYAEEVKKTGFTLQSATSSADVTNAVVWYEAYNKEGYYVVINMAENGGGFVDILKP